MKFYIIVFKSKSYIWNNESVWISKVLNVIYYFLDRVKNSYEFFFKMFKYIR